MFLSVQRVFVQVVLICFNSLMTSWRSPDQDFELSWGLPHSDYRSTASSSVLLWAADCSISQSVWVMLVWMLSYRFRGFRKNKWEQWLDKMFKLLKNWCQTFKYSNHRLQFWAAWSYYCDFIVANNNLDFIPTYYLLLSLCLASFFLSGCIYVMSVALCLLCFLVFFSPWSDVCF